MSDETTQISGTRTTPSQDPWIGEVIYCARPTMAHGGGPDGHYWAVVAVTTDDEGDRWVATMRAATTDEAAPVAARRAAKAQRLAVPLSWDTAR